MTKTECLKRAAAARHAAKVINARAALYASTFGGGDELTQRAVLDSDVANEVAGMWDRFATIHPASRAKQLRNGALPAYMFHPY